MKKLTPEEIKEEMKKIKVPWIVKFVDKFWFKYGRYILFFGILSIFPIGIYYNTLENNIHLAHIVWNIMIGIFFTLLIGIGLPVLISHLIENNFVKKQAKRLGISVSEWNDYAEEIKLYSF